MSSIGPELIDSDLAHRSEALDILVREEPDEQEEDDDEEGENDGDEEGNDGDSDGYSE